LFIENRDALNKLLELPHHEQASIARTIHVRRYGHGDCLAAEFFFHVIVGLRDFGESFFTNTVREKLMGVHSPTTYRAFANTGLKCEWLETVLKTWLDNGGFALGQIQSGSFYHKRQRKKRIQQEVHLDGKIYIQDKHSKPYTLTIGDYIFFKPNDARPIKGNVFVTHFTPVTIQKTG
jgi:hypothetical protein